MTYEQLLHILTNYISEGLIYIDSSRKLKLFNQKAKEITGLVLDKSSSHSAGRIEKGDIVIIADNQLGYDDGDLTSSDLQRIGIKDKSIHENDMFVGIGVYDTPGITPIYKHLPDHLPTIDFSVSAQFMGFHIESTIHSADKIMSIKVNNMVFDVSYIKSVGHLVILDGQTHEVKFFQAKGYSIRKETIQEILQGKPFLAKGDEMEDINVINMPVDDIIEYDELTERMDAIFEKKEKEIIDAFLDINKRPTLCSLFPIMEDKNVLGVLIKIRDVSEIEELLKDRNKMIEEVEKIHMNLLPGNDRFPGADFSEIVGNSPAMQNVKYLAYKASKIKSNVLITGESGTGKSQLAYKIHSLYKEESPFIEVNCSSIPPTLFESELFGYVGGAFTGALPQGKAGYFELANNGTIFLDEIGELPIDIQAKLLYVLQNKKFYRVGGSKPIHINVRVISATNKNLSDEVRMGNFRLDLYYRINVFPIEIPPLRSRKSDLYLLINKILTKICMEYDIPIKEFTGTALNKMLQYDWPGNVRELENVLERAITLCETPILYPEHIEIDAKENKTTLKILVEETEKRAILSALEEFNGNKQLAMEVLGLGKSAFYEKIKKYNITK
ncbi:sigma-54 interaction domain-containing protein [Anaerovorax sp. IOR16]|uniref:sigma-54 interaction domain-containing protein n=1 Tax=Anaerovorax sp. IOR16 TaxID=2773458 RepID=UPI0019CFCB40|nr:sigma 54-interacting transcriptional regulator [Anaerovorax sp. IOR16]